MAAPMATTAVTGTERPRRLAVAMCTAVALVIAVLLAGCSSDSGSDDGADASRRTTTSADRAERTTTSAAPDGTTTTGAPTTTAAPPTSAGGGSSAFRGAVDGQDGVEVTFTRGAAALADVRADGLELTCQPLEGGDSKTVTLDVVIAEVPLGSGGLVEHTEAGAPYEPTLAGSFTPAGAFAGSLSLSGQRDGFACGGEFTFIATPT